MVMNKGLGRQPSAKKKNEFVTTTVTFQGDHHNLETILKTVNGWCFGGRMRGVYIGWGPTLPHSRRPKSHPHARLAVYDAHTRIITVHRALDRWWVPWQVVGWVVYHEMLHHKYRVAVMVEGERCLHPTSFHIEESLYPGLGRIYRWLNKNWARLLRY